MKDIHCLHCVNAISTAIRAADANADVDVDLDAHQVQVASTLAGEEIAAAIRGAGYTPAPILADNV